MVVILTYRSRLKTPTRVLLVDLSARAWLSDALSQSLSGWRYVIVLVVLLLQVVVVQRNIEILILASVVYLFKSCVSRIVLRVVQRGTMSACFLSSDLL